MDLYNSSMTGKMNNDKSKSGRFKAVMSESISKLST
jgi:hypothetical protein